MLERIGEISLEVIKLLDLPLSEATPVYIGVTNIAHIVSEHEYEYYRYFDKIPLILSAPDYVRVKEDDGSIEYIKSFGKYVKLAVRVAGDGNYYARSIYRIRDNVVKRMVKNKTFKPLTKP